MTKRESGTRLAVPPMKCPGCGAEHDDLDGFGFLAHVNPPFEDACGWCSHPARTGGVCGICGDVETEEQALARTSSGVVFTPRGPIHYTGGASRDGIWVENPTGLFAGDLAVLEQCLPDGKPPHEITNDAIHWKLEKLGLMNHRFGEAPDGGGADFWSTNENGMWALRVAKKAIAAFTANVTQGKTST